MLYYNDLSKSNRVVSKFVNFSFFIYILSYYLLFIYNILTTLLSYYISIHYKGSNLLFFVLNLATLLFFCSKAPVQHIFVLVFGDFLLKNRKKSANFLQFFLSVYQLVRRNLKKKFVKRLDKI